MTRLLVSVRTAAEAAAALAGGADLVDVKDPARGALGAADATVWRQVLAVTAGRVPASAALGELSESGAVTDTAALVRFDYVKLGLADCAAHRDWPARWQAALAACPPGPIRVAVVYADWQTAAAPPPAEILAHAARLGCGAVLIDTYTKDGRDLTQYAEALPLNRLVAAARDANLAVVLGGSLGAATIPQVLPLRPDYIAVRGAACRGSRTGLLDAALVRALKQQLPAEDTGGPRAPA